MLSDESIIEIIKDYLDDEKMKYALLMNGEWGCGKTYFIKEQLVLNLKNSPNYNALNIFYISLYCITSVEDFLQQLITQIIFIKSVDENKKLEAESKKKKSKRKCETQTPNKIINFGTQLLSAALRKTEFLNADILYSLNSFLVNKSTFLIIDDLERCSMPINAIFGVLANLIESNNIKILVVANEKEIGSVSFQHNIELKYLISSKLLESPPTENSTISNRENDLKKLINKSEELFSEDVHYKLIKEKIIGKTIHYSPEFNNLLQIIGKKYLGEDEYKVYVRIKNELNDYIKRNNHQNLRTVEFAFSSFMKISHLLQPVLVERPTDFCDHFFELLLIDIFRTAIRIKNGEQEYQWESTSQFCNITDGGSPFILSNRHLAFRFVRKYLQTHELIIEDASSVLDEYYIVWLNRNTEDNDPVNKLRFYMEKEDDEIVELVKELENQIIEKKYPIRNFKRALGILFVIKSVKFEIGDTVEKILSAMAEQVISNPEKLSVMNESLIWQNNPLFPEYEKSLTNLINIAEEVANKNKSTYINKLFLENNDTWAQDFFRYCEEHADEFLLRKSFMSSIDISLCIEFMIKSKPKDLFNVLKGLNAVYNMSNVADFFMKDAPSLRLFKEKLVQINFDSKICQHNLNEIINTVSLVIGKLELISI